MPQNQRRAQPLPQTTTTRRTFATFAPQNRASGRVTNPFLTTTRRFVTTTTRFTTRPTTTTTTRRVTQTTTRFIQAVTAPPPPANNNPLARCRQIQSDPSLAAEVLIRERLIFAAEGNNFKNVVLFTKWSIN